jgi:cobalt-zinc-cadmium efflux system outer membrane protein
MTILLLMTSGCATVDHRADLETADRLMSAASGLQAQWSSPGEEEALSIEEDGTVALEFVIRRTLSSNRALLASLEAIAQARANEVQAGLLPNPLLTLAAGFPEGGGRVNLAFGLSQDFAEIWLIPSKKRAARAVLQQRILQFVDAAVELLAQTRTTYAQLQYAVRASELYEENQAVLRDALVVAESRFLAGETGELDVNLLRSRQLETEVNLLRVRAEAGVLRRRLLRTMGLARGADAWRPTDLASDRPPEPPVLSQQQLVEIGLLQRLDVQAALWELEAAVAEYEVQRRRVISELSLGFFGERSERRGQPGRDILADTARTSLREGQLTAPEIESRAQRRQEHSREIDLILGPSVEVALPIFDQNQARIAYAQSRARELRWRYEEMEQRAAEGIRIAHVELQRAAGRAALLHDSLLPLQKANLRLARAAYEAGNESVLTVLLAQESLIVAKLEYVAALRDFAVAEAELEREVSGRPDDFPLESASKP